MLSVCVQPSVCMGVPWQCAACNVRVQRGAVQLCVQSVSVCSVSVRSGSTRVHKRCLCTLCVPSVNVHGTRMKHRAGVHVRVQA